MGGNGFARIRAVVVALALSLAALLPGTALATTQAVPLAGSAPAVRPAAPAVASTPANAAIEFEVSLRLREPAGAAALERAVSDPSSPSYRQFLTPAAWERRFSPTQASVSAVTAWLSSHSLH